METIISTELFDLIRFNDAPEREAVIYITSRNFDGGAQAIYTELDTSISFYELRVDNWDDNLTPWAADAKMKGRAFGGDGGKLLESIISDVIPVVGSQSARLYIAGYSLAGLFSLWSLFESDIFAGCTCCSGSLWYPGWLDYLKKHRVNIPSRIYLSVGNREKNSKNEFMKTVEDAYAVTKEYLDTDANIETHFDLNEGGHFNNVNERIVKGLRWLLL